MEEKTTNWLSAVIENKGIDWVTAAMVEGSIGYHTPAGAKKLINDFLNGVKESFCERCYCCYNANLERMITSDIEGFEYLEGYDPSKVKRITGYTKKMIDEDTVSAIASGLMYPTAMI